MKLARFSDGGAPRVGVVCDERVIPIDDHAALAGDMRSLISRWPAVRTHLASSSASSRGLPIDGVRLLAPIERPGKIVCIGLNYADHCVEVGLPRPAHQMWFSKVATSASGPSDDIELPVVSHALDYEAELVMVIGKRCRHVPRERAKEVVFGYCVGNDVSVRDWQMRTSQFFIGKAFDGHAPFGPWITTADEIAVDDLAIRCTVNDELRQNSRTSQLIFGCYDQVALLSQAMTLDPGDVIFTGTPGGVGAGFKPPKFLRAGDTVRIEIEGLGSITNRVVQGSGTTFIE